MCTAYVRKEANRFNWLVKGKLIDISWTDQEVEKLYHSYFERLWGNNENYIHESGFELAWKIRENELLDNERKYVAVLGYD